MTLRILFPLLLAFPLVGSCADHGRYITFGEIYQAYESKSELTSEQRSYLMGVVGAVKTMDAASWRDKGRGLYCPPDGQWVDSDFVLSVMEREIGSDRGWAYGTGDAAAVVLVNGLLMQYPCTDAAVDRIKKRQADVFDRVFKSKR